MDRICVIADTEVRARDLGAKLAGFFETRFFQLAELPEAAPEEFTLVDVDLRDAGYCFDLKNWLKRRPRNGQAIFCVRKDSHAQAVQACAIGATGLLARPINGYAVMAKFAERRKAEANAAAAEFTAEGAAGVSAGASALHEIFEAAMSGGPLDVSSVNAAGETVVAGIDEDGLARWIDLVRKHHSQTYQHCLIVTGVAVGFARHLGFSRADQRRLAAAGLLHDIGKARIPLEILEKPGPLDEAEFAVMKEPLLGLEALQSSPGLPPDMIDMVVHHHEYLDGSGYPHGLQGNEISDLVRTITVADIFGALIERRSYKPALTGVAAYEILQTMGGKLDRDLVREFRAIAQVR